MLALSSGTGRAYNVSGDRGALITYAYPSAKTLLIGSQRAEELAAAIRELLDRCAS